MCGISGVITSGGGIDPALLLAHGRRIEHRGPDGEGYLIWASAADGRLRRSTREEVASSSPTSAEVGFAHRRLTIIDLQRAQRPAAVDASGGLRDLLQRRDLQLPRAAGGARGPRALVPAPRGTPRWCSRPTGSGGRSASSDLSGCGPSRSSTRAARGCSSLATASGSSRSTTPGRPGRLYFASEIKALLAVPGLHLEPDEEALRALPADRRLDVDRAHLLRRHQQPAARPTTWRSTSTRPPSARPSRLLVRFRRRTGGSRRARGRAAARAARGFGPHPRPERRPGRHLPERRPRFVVDRLPRRGAARGRRDPPLHAQRVRLPARRTQALLRASPHGGGRRAGPARGCSSSSPRSTLRRALLAIVAPAGRALRLDQHRRPVVRLRGRQRRRE